MNKRYRYINDRPWVEILKHPYHVDICINYGDIVYQKGIDRYFLPRYNKELVIKGNLAQNLEPALTDEQIEYYTKLRDNAAVRAMQAILSSDKWVEQINEEAKKSMATRRKEDFSDIVSDYAVLYADNLVQRLIEEDEVCPKQENRE